MKEGAAIAETYRSTETPSYRVALAEGAFELRDYGPRLMAEVTVEGDAWQARRAGFQILAGYIFGANEGRQKVDMTSPVSQTPTAEKIAMTTPVSQTPDAAGAWVVQFMMPGEYRLETLPRAQDPRIRFLDLPPKRQAVLRFSGQTGDVRLAEQAAELKRWMAARGLVATGGPHFLFYDPPWTRPELRRNEVACDLG